MTTATFPSSPINGQIAEVGGRYYSYNTTIGAWENIGAIGGSPTLASITITANANISANLNAGNVNSSGSITTTNLSLNANNIISTNTNGNINITPNGSGLAIISNLLVSNTLSFSDSSTQTTAGIPKGNAIALAIIFG